MTRILFLHGLESSPQGAKVQFLRGNSDYEVEAPELETRDAIIYLREHLQRSLLPASRYVDALASASQAVESFSPDVVVGSSYGGGLAALLADRGVITQPLVLLAPAAIKLFGVSGLTHSERVLILHGRGDEVVPPLHSWMFAAESRGDVQVWMVDDDHRLMAAINRGVLDEAIAWVLAAKST